MYEWNVFYETTVQYDSLNTMLKLFKGDTNTIVIAFQKQH